MSNSYLPSNDLAFQTWFGRFMTYLAAHAVQLGLTEEDVTALTGVRTAFNTALTAHQTAQTAAKAACTDKSAKRGISEQLIRSAVARIQANPGTTNIDREELGIPIHGQAAVPGSGEQSDDKPAAIIDISQHMRHVIRVYNVSSTTPSKARPAGMVSCEIRRKVGAVPIDQMDTEIVDVTAKNPITLDYSGADAGKVVHYVFRWVSRTGEKGNWSDIESATIAA